jgi:hypothetical protein
MPKKAKHQKLDVPYHVALHSGPTAVGGRAAEKVLKFVKEHGLANAISRRSSRRQRHDYVTELTDYGSLLRPLQVKLDNGEDMQVTAISPFALLSRTVKECRPFRSLMCRTLAKHPCTVSNPWGIILYFDEVTPTDPRNTKPDKRKIQCFYWTFREFDELISCEEVWFIATTTRSVIVNQLEVGMSELVKDVLANLFFNPDAQHFGRSGCSLQLSEPRGPPQLVRLYAVHSITIADFLALKDVVQSLGQNALKPCPCCSNIVKADIAEGSPTLLPLHSLERDRFALRSDQSVRNLQDSMRDQRASLSDAKFAELESRNGYHYSPNSILNALSLQYKPISTLMFDWPHVYLLHGIVQYDMDEFMSIARAITPSNQKAIISHETLGDHVEKWTWPKRFAPCQSAFVKGRLDATASEILSLVPVLRHFFADVVLKTPSLDALHDGATAMVALWDVLEAFLCATRAAIDPAELDIRILDHLRKAQHAFGVEYQKFKHHMPLHLAKMYERSGRLINSLVTERKHRNPKRLAFARRSQSNYDFGVMEDLLLQHFQDWNDWVDRVGIKSAHAITDRELKVVAGDAFPHAHEILTGVEFVSRPGAIFHLKDYVLLASNDLHRITLGQVMHFLEVDGTHWIALATWPSRRVVHADGDYAMYAHYTIADETPLLIESSRMACVAIVRRSASHILAIVPRLFQLQVY